MADDTILYQTGSITVVRYRSMIRQREKGVLVKFIHDRFSERYITPLRAIPKSPKNLRNGFCTMAICCLMVEALESFWQGLPNTRAGGASRAAFVSFFNRSNNLKAFRPHADEFYTHVRCGILHQAETTGGWKYAVTVSYSFQKASPLTQPAFTTNFTSVSSLIVRPLSMSSSTDRFGLHSRAK